MINELKQKNILKRERYLSQIEPFMGQPLVKVITGQRRVGKSYFLYQIMEHIKSVNGNSNIIYINKEDMTFDTIKNAQDLVDYIKTHLKKNKRNVILIDEIQEISEFEKSIRSLLLDKNNDIYITGSNANLLSGDFATLIAGRTIEIPIFSLSYPEFLEFHDLIDSDESLNKFMKYGGLPYLKNLELTEQIANEYLHNIYNTIIYRDVVAKNNVRSTYFLEQLIRFLASNMGSIFSAKRISDFLKSQQVKIPPNQVQTFIAYLTNAFIVHKIPRYDIVGKRVFEMGEKIYFQDLGIRNIISGFRPDDLGKVLENIVLNHLLYRGFEVKVGKINSHEIDFIAKQDEELQYIQVALRLGDEKTIEREFGNLKQINDNYPKLVISMDKDFPNTVDGIEHNSIRIFLLK